MSINTNNQNISNGGSATSVTQTIDVGTPRHPTGWSTTEIRYHNFTHLPHKKGDHTDSLPFIAHGFDWYLRIHPGGAASANGEDFISVYLRCKTAAEQNVAIQAEFSLALLRSDGQIDSMMSCPCNAFRRKRKGWPNFINRSRLLDRSSQLLDEYGTLTVIVKVQLFQERDTNFVPRNEIGLIKLLKEANSTDNDGGGINNEERSSTADTADVKFCVEGETFHAHRLVLKLFAPTLAHLCEDVDEDTTIPITGVRSHIFQGLLRFVYGDAVPDALWTSTNDAANADILTSPAVELLDAANQFGVVGLKILAETKVAESSISISNASDLISFADAKNCALLKERVVDYFVIHADKIRKHPSFQKVKESAILLYELMDAVLSKRILRSFSLGENDVDYNSMGVNLLRRKLDERGQDVDGSREMLIQRLEIGIGRIEKGK
mmetsp:Transcript_21967/g.47707  ORF Transcript_21967/g.47707 Transcript_21967/m.47707 type:complete len:437 (-) Transcript_21967:42-1352(-)|eukprot:CAMPEP_0172315810 /NCGR_PEP_ID=MMETSP1058-20130122/26359_1 /TAXON_ID=83371 /ORGANISM="Detonula confervacea, Strain CCMP 353" /LENGTH=436 /DNA_ID=CAMNT_0013029975 /DNA_START=253 /DNA_END=1563 /DNA_ORIENTATION=-